MRRVATYRVAPSLTGRNLRSCRHAPVERISYNEEVGLANEIAFTAGILHSAAVGRDESVREVVEIAPQLPAKHIGS